MPDIADLGKYMQDAHAELLKRSLELETGAPAALEKPAAAKAPAAPRRKAPAKTAASKPSRSRKTVAAK